MALVAHRAAPIRAGGIDWAAHWRQMVEARQASETRRAPEGQNRWDDRAQRFARLTQGLDPATEPFVLALKSALRPTDTVLDVGAGAGRYSMAIAPAVARLTAVEPSPGMRAAFEAEAKSRGLGNVQLVAGSWEEADIEPHDVAFVANVLYFVPDAVAFIEKLDRAATRACYIFHRVEEIATALGPAGIAIRGSRPPEPGFVELYNLLFAMGIRAHATLVRAPFAARFATLDEAVAESHQLLGLDPGDTSRDEQLRLALQDALVEGPGGLGYRQNPQMAIIWWEKVVEREDYIVGDPESLIHVDWSGEWRP
jgi:SAM-dependent methyltransferase